MDHKVKKRDIPFVLLFLAPGIILFFLTILLPSIFAIKNSFWNLSFFGQEGTFAGFSNYARILTDDRFWRDLGITAVYAGGTVLFQLLIGIANALILNNRFRGRGLLRGITVIPYIIPPIAITIIWQWMMDPSWGILTKLTNLLGLQNFQFFSMHNVMWTACFISIWAWTPFVTLVFLAGLQTVPEELYESSTLDGASKWQQFWKVTVPVLKPVISTIVLLRSIWMFNKFDLMWILTGGGPLEKTETLPILTYLYTFKFYDIGGGSAIAVISLLIIGVAMYFYLRISKSNNIA